MVKKLVFLIASCCVLASAQAAVLFTNGAITASGDNCDQGPTGCGASNGIGFTYADNFSLTANSLVTGFAYTDFFFQGSTSDYLSTQWSIWSGNPAQPGATALFSGSAIANVSANGAFAGSFEFTVDGLSLQLDDGVYWLGIKNQVANGAITTIARVSENDSVPGDVAIEFDGTGWITHPAFSDRAFNILGSVAEAAAVPEPATAWLCLAAIATLGFLPRRRSKAGSTG